MENSMGRFFCAETYREIVCYTMLCAGSENFPGRSPEMAERDK